MTNKRFFSLNASPSGFGETPDDLTQDMFVSDIPLQHSHEYFEDEGQGLYVGVWDTTDMIEVAGPYACDEFMYLLQGEATIRNCETGEMETVKAGQPFVIPKGYNCQWHQSGYLRKFFLISEHPDESIPENPAVEGIVIPRADAPMNSISDPEAFIDAGGLASQRQHLCHEDGTGRFRVGTWESDAFESSVAPFPYHQFAWLIEGTLTLLDQEGKEHDFSPGDALFVPEGVLCGARAAEKVKLFFAIVRPPAE